MRFIGVQMHGKYYRSFSLQAYWTNLSPSECLEGRHYICYEGIHYINVKERQKTPVELSFILFKLQKIVLCIPFSVLLKYVLYMYICEFSALPPRVRSEMPVSF